MPGLVGFTLGPALAQDEGRILEKMRAMIAHQSFYKGDQLFTDSLVAVSRSHINVLPSQSQPHKEGEVLVWLDGELYNRDELSNGRHASISSDAALLGELFIQNHGSFSFLRRIDGDYSAVIYDRPRQALHLITDRYAMRQLYWTIVGDSVVWASELKAFLAFPLFAPRIDPEAITEFLEIGYLLEDRTWFLGVHLLSPGSVLTVNLSTSSVQKQRYWWWADIEPLRGPFDNTEIAEELGRLFIQAVLRRSSSQHRFGIELSGGLDSRAILAAMPQQGTSLQTVTFGKPGCDDIRIAARVAKLKRATHHIVELTAQNWLLPRLGGVWWTDGELALLHMHGIEGLNLYREWFDIVVHGHAGDVILGGSFLTQELVHRPASRELVAQAMRCNPDLLTSFKEYSALHTSDFYFLQNRLRRFAFTGIKYAQTAVVFRTPFYDNKLFEYVYSLPNELRYKSFIYKRMLLQNFPLFYKGVPWQKTGVPINWPSVAERAGKFRRRLHRAASWRLAKIGINWKSDANYTDYPNWIRQEPARSFFSQILENPAALYPEFYPRWRVIEALDAFLVGGLDYMNGINYAEMLCRYLTLEIWLQQVFEKRYRESPSMTLSGLEAV
ncbi:hypothetical protein CLG94_12465 [Candidatus Methylomirabilis limnetica]|uniref:asparagine synthase (glutamine-hydrolyzing) n=1 Tax=Candidatus Methylomirabilis limnetica TaxID=2033718 RepID=A0A2T4TUW9_9BACT|nr:asparagine synthase-related protein [Candidatus Methylomirabilis limnetica]PTL34905.1 hypothetical protein CLG94_12465 [Candidatus Methylomirabilis limnetica]